jgi:lysophospholipase L1-like esterase
LHPPGEIIVKRLALVAFLLLAPAAGAAEPFAFQYGDRVVLIGNTLIEREQRAGYWETALTALHPYKRITFRNLGWSGDTVWGEAQGRFGGQAEGFRHLKEHVATLQPTVLLIGYGFNEAFAGPAGLPKFEAGLDTLLDTLAATKARMVLLGPQRQGDLGRPLPDPTANNKNIALYRDSMRKIADKRGYPFIDLYDLLGNENTPLTDDGIHLTDDGYRRSAGILARALCGRGLPRSGDIDVDGPPGGWRFEFQLDWLPPPAPPDGPSRFEQVMTYPGLVPGKYALFIDGRKVLAADAADWAKGVKLPSGPDLEQVEKLRAKIIEKNQTYFHRWRPQNETYLFLFRKNEQGQNAKEIPEFDPLVEELEEEITSLRVPAVHRYEIRAEKGSGG